MNSKFPPGSPQAYEEEMRWLPRNTKLDKKYVSPRTRQLFQDIPESRAYKNAGSAFFWIAGPSLTNSLVQVFGGGFYFLAGLDITQMVDGIAAGVAKEIPDISRIVIGAGFFLDLGILAMIALFGVLAAKQYKWSIITGMVLYAPDALLVLLFKDFTGFAFHLFFLGQIWSALRVLNFGKSKPNRQWMPFHRISALPDNP